MRLLDLFCGAGGCSVGYSRAGFTEITGVDVAPMPRYPFRFVQADALELLAQVNPGEYDLIHASPPCQAYSRMRHLPWLKEKQWPSLIEPVRDRLQSIGTPYVIENVEGAPLRDPVLICGTMLGLKVYRHRLFECSEWMLQLPHCQHTAVIGPGRLLATRLKPNEENGFVSMIRGNSAQAKRVFECEWMTSEELSQAIPPAYTEWIGRRMME